MRIPIRPNPDSRLESSYLKSKRPFSPSTRPQRQALSLSTMHLTQSATIIATTLLSTYTTLTTATPAGDPTGSSVITLEQARAVNDLLVTAHRTGRSARSLLGDIFGGGDDGDQPRGYAPYNVTCPEGITWNRPADSLGSVETSYLDARQSQLDSAWQSQTSRLGLTMPSRTPKVAMSLSGGGYRAMIHGSGQAFLQNTTEGSVGDVLGLSTYVGGLSGGSWAISSWLANDGAQPDYLVRNVSGRAGEGMMRVSLELCEVRG